MPECPSESLLVKVSKNSLWIKTCFFFLFWCISVNSRLISQDPRTVLDFFDRIGNQYCFQIKALPENATQDLIYGTTIYSGNSVLRTAVVHAGWLQRGEIGVLKVDITPIMLDFGSSTQNGITSKYVIYYRLGFQFVDYCCEDGKYNIPGSPDCFDCQEGCALCGAASNCLSCIEGYGLYDSICQKCPDGSHSNGQREPCTSCTVGCATCSSDNFCSSCIPGYYLQGSQCIQCTNGTTSLGGTSTRCNLNCSEGCKTCYSPTVCLECESSFLLDNMDTGSECKACPYLCDACEDATHCTTCNYKAVNMNKKCWKCGRATYSNGTSCAECSFGCVNCKSANDCIECSAHYALQDGKCHTKSPPWSSLAADVITIISLVSLAVLVVFVMFGAKAMVRWLSKQKKD